MDEQQDASRPWPPAGRGDEPAAGGEPQSIAGLLAENAALRAEAAASREAAEALRQGELLLRSLVEQSSEGIVLIDGQGIVVEWNEAEAEMTGIGRDRALGRPLWDVQFELALDGFKTPEAYEATRQRIAEALTSGRAPWFNRLFEREIERPDGTRRVVQSLTFPIRTERGLMIGSTSRDVTERRDAQTAIQNTARFPAENPHPVLRLARDGTILYANDASLPLLQEWAGQVGGAAPAGWRERVAAALAGDTRSEVEVECGGRLFALVVVPIPAAGYVNLYGSDVTERRRAEDNAHRERRRAEELAAALRRERDILEVTMENTRAHLAYLDAEFNFVRVNSAYARGAGRPAAELIGHNHFELFPDAQNQSIFERVRATGRPAEFLARPFKYADRPARGMTYWDWTLTPVMDTAGRMQGLVLSLTDVTERIHAEGELRHALLARQQRQAEVAALLAGARAVLAYRDFRQAARAIFDVCKELLGATVGYIVLHSAPGGPEADPVILLDAGGQEQTGPGLFMPIGTLAPEVIAGGEPYYDNAFADSAWAALHLVGHPPVQNVLLAPLTVEGKAAGLLGLGNKPGGFSDNDARLATAFAELAAIALWNARLNEQAGQAAAIEERHRLSRELHDAVSQTLFSASLIAEVLPRVWERNPEAGRRSLQDLRDMNRGALAEMRMLLAELRPGVLLEGGLEVLLPHLADAATGRSHIPIALDLEAPGPLPPEVQVNLYRVAQEALSNVAKHSGADRATVSLRRLPLPGDARPGLELRIVDDGRGFDVERVAANCLGLDIMRERAQQIGADLAVETRPGAGTEVRVTWPGSP